MDQLPPDLIEQILQQVQYPVVKEIAKIDVESFWVFEASNHVAKRSELYIEMDFLPKEEEATLYYRQTRYENCASVNFLNRPNASKPPEERFIELTHVMLKGDERLPVTVTEVDVDDFSEEEYNEPSESGDPYADSALRYNEVDDDYDDAESHEWVAEDDDRWFGEANGELPEDEDYDNDYYDDEDPYPNCTVVPPSPKPKVNTNNAILRQSLSLFALRDMSQFKESSLVIDSFTEKEYPAVGPLIDLLTANFAHFTMHNLVGFGDNISRLLSRFLQMRCVRHIYITQVDMAAINPDLLVPLLKMGSLTTFYFSGRFQQRVPILDVDKLVDLTRWWASGGGARSSKLQQVDIRFTRPSWRSLREKLEVVEPGKKKQTRNAFQISGEQGNVSYQLKDGMLIMSFHKE